MNKAKGAAWILIGVIITCLSGLALYVALADALEKGFGEDPIIAILMVAVFVLIGVLTCGRGYRIFKRAGEPKDAAPAPSDHSRPPFASRGFLGVCLIFILLFLASGGLVFLIEIPYHLAFGWIIFPIKTFSRISLNAGAIATGLAALALLTAGAHYFLGWFYGHWASTGASSAAMRWTYQRTLAVVAMFILMFAAGIASIGAAHLAYWIARSPIISIAIDSRLACSIMRSDLTKLAAAEDEYFDKVGRYSERLEELTELAPNRDVVITILKADGNGFIAQADHESCGEGPYTWDSMNGGMQ